MFFCMIWSCTLLQINLRVSPYSSFELFPRSFDEQLFFATMVNNGYTVLSALGRPLCWLRLRNDWFRTFLQLSRFEANLRQMSFLKRFLSRCNSWIFTRYNYKPVMGVHQLGCRFESLVSVPYIAPCSFDLGSCERRVIPTILTF